jgi:hypothetical protein
MNKKIKRASVKKDNIFLFFLIPAMVITVGLVAIFLILYGASPQQQGQPYLNTTNYPISSNYPTFPNNTSPIEIHGQVYSHLWIETNAQVYEYLTSFHFFQSGDPCVLQMRAIENGTATYILDKSQASATINLVSFATGLSVCSNYTN